MITICTPTRDDVDAGFAMSLAYLMRSYTDSNFIVMLGTLLPNLRQGLVKQAMSIGSSHVLFIDSDMSFPPYTLHQLMRADKDIIGANCVQRTQDEWTARKDGHFVSSLNKTGIEQVDTLGFGVTLIKMKVFETVERPWFNTPYDGEKHEGEDVSFCRKARDAGFKIFIDHDLSQEIGHVASTIKSPKHMTL